MMMMMRIMMMMMTMMILPNRSPHLEKLVFHLTFVILALPEDGQCHCLTICFLIYISDLTNDDNHNQVQL